MSHANRLHTSIIHHMTHFVKMLPKEKSKNHPEGWFFDYKLLVLSLACCFRLLLALNAGLLVVLTLAKIGQDVRPCALTLEAAESTVQRLALFYLDFCHDFFPSPRIRRRYSRRRFTERFPLAARQTLCILYPISLNLSIGFRKIFFAFLHKNPRRLPRAFGADNQIRTDDLLITNEVLYRLSYISVSLIPSLPRWRQTWIWS